MFEVEQRVKLPVQVIGEVAELVPQRFGRVAAYPSPEAIASMEGAGSPKLTVR